MTSIGHHLIGVVTDSIGTIMQGIKGVFSVVGKIGGSNKQKNNGGANSNNTNGPLNPEVSRSRFLESILCLHFLRSSKSIKKIGRYLSIFNFKIEIFWKTREAFAFFTAKK